MYRKEEPERIRPLQERMVKLSDQIERALRLLKKATGELGDAWPVCPDCGRPCHWRRGFFCLDCLTPPRRPAPTGKEEGDDHDDAG